MKSPERDVDAATIEVVRNYLLSATNEMERTLIRTAYNPVIYEIADFGISLYDHELNLIADSPGLALFLGTNDLGLRKGIEHIGKENLHPGDIAILNYPYWSGAHTLDVCLFAPIFPENTTPDTTAESEELLGYAVLRAHWLDLGQKDAGYVLDSSSVHQEGIIFPGTKIYKRGQLDEEKLDLIRFNSRGPNKVIGDLNAQIAAVETGKRRLRELVEKYEIETVRSCIDQIISHGERMAREGISELPNGTWSATDFIDNDGINDELVKLGVEVTIRDEEFVLDFSPSSEQVEGPINVPYGQAETIGKLCLKTLTTPGESSNAGHYKPLTVTVPEDNIYNAGYPSATFTIWPAIIGIDMVFKALSSAIPQRVPASSGSDLCSVSIFGYDDETGHVFLDSSNEGVGWGAFQDQDGQNALMHFSECATQNTPVEVFESRSGVIFERYELRTDSGGPGKFRGGLGVRRDYRLTEDANMFCVLKKTRVSGWGLDGGKSGARNCLKLDNLNNDWEERLRLYVNNDDLYEPEPDAVWTGMCRGRVNETELISNRSGGGGGVGDPYERPVENVQEDYLDGYISQEAAEREYGVVLKPNGEIDHVETSKRRDKQ